MGAAAQHLGAAIALILVIEGLLYALFPDNVRRFMAMAALMPSARLRIFGIGAAAAGFFILAILKTSVH